MNLKWADVAILKTGLKIGRLSLMMLIYVMRQNGLSFC